MQDSVAEEWEFIGKEIFEAKDAETLGRVKEICDNAQIEEKVIGYYDNVSTMQQALKDWVDRENTELQLGSNECTNLTDLLNKWETHKKDQHFLLKLLVAIAGGCETDEIDNEEAGRVMQGPYAVPTLEQLQTDKG